MYSELMSGTVHSNLSPISDVTFAVFEDSGWFDVHYQVGSPECFVDPSWCVDEDDGKRQPRFELLWGADRGCSFVTGSCAGPAWRKPGYFCEDFTDKPACTLGRLEVGHCTARLHEQVLPPQFRYFEDSTRGGLESEDYCPVVAAYSNYDCTWENPQYAEFIRKSERDHGEKRGENSRCFLRSLYNGSDVAEESPGCYPHRCLSPTRLQLFVANSWHACDEEDDTITVPGWTGSLRCAPASELCVEAEDLRWPDISSVEPDAGPSEGGMPITITGANLFSAHGTYVFVCGINATSVKATSDGNLLAITAASNDLVGNATCHVRVSHAEGRYDTMYGAYIYIGPEQQQQPIDLSGGWTLDKALSLTMRLWPYLMTGVVVLASAHWMYVIFSELMVQRYIEQAHARARCERDSRSSSTTR